MGRPARGVDVDYLTKNWNISKMIPRRGFLLLSNPRDLRGGNFDPKEKVKLLTFLFVHF